MAISAYLYAAGEKEAIDKLTAINKDKLSNKSLKSKTKQTIQRVEAPMSSQQDLSYAIQMTETVLAPESNLSTFGATVVDYHVVSELLDEIGKVRIRRGRIHAERPQVITPTYYANQLLENFGEDAEEYADMLRNSREGMRILQYGLRFRKEEATEETVEGQIKDVADQIVEEITSQGQTMAGVVIGVDDMWEVSLLKFASEVIQGSAPANFRELSDKGLLEATSHDVPNAVRIEIESEFRQAEGDRDRIHALGNKLRHYGLLEEYEDRFFDLVNQLKE